MTGGKQEKMIKLFIELPFAQGWQHRVVGVVAAATLMVHKKIDSRFFSLDSFPASIIGSHLAQISKQSNIFHPSLHILKLLLCNPTVDVVKESESFFCMAFFAFHFLCLSLLN